MYLFYVELCSTNVLLPKCVVCLLSQSCHREDDDDKQQEVESFEVSECAFTFKIHLKCFKMLLLLLLLL